jgi:enolase
MAGRIVSVSGDEILDSRGYPTLRVDVRLDDGTVGRASVPSGASTGEAEAHELRDGDPQRYGGRGVLKALANLAEIGAALAGRDPAGQREIDEVLIGLDGTASKARLGANAIVGTSMAVARAAASAAGQPLYAYLAEGAEYRLPVPMMNVVNGGRHAANSLDFQEFMIVPHGAPSFREALRWGAETYHALRKVLTDRGLAVGVGDEGGFAPDLPGNENACELIVEAIERAGYRPGEQIALALDPAASSFWHDRSYRLTDSGLGVMTTSELGALYEDWVRRFPIVSIEDGFGERDWLGFQAQTAALGHALQIVGDDLYVTNPEFIERGIRTRATNAVLIKLNQIGTVTETIDAIRACRRAGWNFIISHRSGETDDAFIADFAVAMNGGQIKAGAPCRGERIAKYNRLLEIEREVAGRSSYSSPFAAAPAGSARTMATGVKPEGDAREVVAIIEEAETAELCLSAAHHAMKRAAVPLALTALHFCVDPARLAAASEEIDLQELREIHEGRAAERSQRVRRVFDDWRARSGVAATLRVHDGGIESSLRGEVRNAAVVAIAEPHNLDSADALHAAIFSSDRLVLYIPAGAGPPHAFGDNMTIAWRAGPQARRAVERALPWLRGAHKVTAVIVNDTNHSRAGEMIRALLNEHRIAHDLHHVRTDSGQHVAARLLQEARSVGADSLVMGAYRFGQLYEMVFGGVTREVIRRTGIPVFMCH